MYLSGSALTCKNSMAKVKFQRVEGWRTQNKEVETKEQEKGKKKDKKTFHNMCNPLLFNPTIEV